MKILRWGSLHIRKSLKFASIYLTKYLLQIYVQTCRSSYLNDKMLYSLTLHLKVTQTATVKQKMCNLKKYLILFKNDS